MNKKILIINTVQFGINTDAFKYCQYLNDKYEITYLSFDQGFIKLSLPNVTIKYISSSGSKLIRGCRFLLHAIIAALFFKGIIYVMYFDKCVLLKKILFWKMMYVDVRTLSVSLNADVRDEENRKLKKDINCFNRRMLISDGVKSKLGLVDNNTYTLPLGADIVSKSNKEFSTIHLLYIGTLSNRQIVKTLDGLKIYLDKSKDTSDLFYDIVGNGEEYDSLAKRIQELSLSKYVKLWGWKSLEELKPFLERANIGVSFIPITDYYEYQPPTKTFEYILSGLYCIATKTYANQEIINTTNGFLINDTPLDFARALYYIKENHSLFNSSQIRNTLLNYQWENIVNNILFPILVNKSN